MGIVFKCGTWVVFYVIQWIVFYVINHGYSVYVVQWVVFYVIHGYCLMWYNGYSVLCDTMGNVLCGTWVVFMWYNGYSVLCGTCSYCLMWYNGYSVYVIQWVMFYVVHG